jgi:hypothetical protein
LAGDTVNTRPDFGVTHGNSCAVEQNTGLCYWLFRANVGGWPLIITIASRCEMFDSEAGDIEGMAQTSAEVVFVPALMVCASYFHQRLHVLDFG